MSHAVVIALILASASAVIAQAPAGGWDAEFQKRLDWWSLKPMSKAAPPVVNDDRWSLRPVDRFVKAALDAADLAPAPPADAVTLRRRLAFVLTGLPPAAHPFGSIPSHQSYVEALLSSPSFGERFARHWMDVVRYTDTYGYEWDNPAKGSHEYRDYLVRAFNDDIGFDQLLREHIAGDLLPRPRLHSAPRTCESLIGPMFYHMGEHRHGSSLMFNGIHQEMVNNKIDAFSKAFLATTVACARCHDHKLEAVSQRDYYSLAAILTTPRWTARVIDAPGMNDAAIARLQQLRDAIRAEMAALWRPVRLPDNLAHPFAKPGWREARAAARKTNAAAFQPVEMDRWVFEGDGFKHGRVSEAAPLITLAGGDILARLLPAGWHTHALSSKLPGALRTPPQHETPGRHLSLRLAGGEFGGHLVVDDRAFQNETVVFYTNIEPEWRTFADPALKNGVQQSAIEFCTAPLNPNFPPRTGLAKGLRNSDFGFDKRSWISITGILSHERGGAPQDELDACAASAQGGLRGVLDRWCEGSSITGDSMVLNWLLQNGHLPNEAAPGSRLASLVDEYRRVEATIPFPRAAMSMDERAAPPASYPLNERGNPDALGDLQRPAFLKMLDSGGSIRDRLALASALLHPEHPLTARVYVNRVWQWIFGAGIVATPDDFGRLGAVPSHPELLDWLAREFIREGWSTKKLVRHLVLSAAFQQSGITTAEARERDPANRLLHHHPTRRLEAEAVRDSLLAVSGRLDLRLGGRPILPHRVAEDDKKRLFSGPLDGEGRRSLYLQMSIMEPPKFLTGFNLPDLKLPSGKRDVTNVPTQALLMLNDPFVNSMAKHWAARLMTDSASSAEQRVHAMFTRAFSREPYREELGRWRAALQSLGGNTPAAWEGLAHAFFNAKEFIYYR